MKRTGFSLLELLVVMSIIVVLLSISLPSLLGAKDSALALVAMGARPDDEGKVFLEINDRPNRKATDDIYMIAIDHPIKSSVRLKKPLPSGLKLRRRDGCDYIFWQPKPRHVGRHPVTVILEGEETSRKEITIYVYTREQLEAQRAQKNNPH
jgi:prepilin-type N-terminal cleavage/methylation domain-containing protein